MVRALSLAAAACLLLGAARAPTVDYRLGIEAAGSTPSATVEIRLVGDADGETRLRLPDHNATAAEASRGLSEITVKGATITEDGPTARILRHKPNARITISYRLQPTDDQARAGAVGDPLGVPLIRPDGFALMGEFVFATPEGRDRQPATFRWSKLPGGWRGASDLEHGRMGRPMALADIRQSISIGGPDLVMIERSIPGGALRFAATRAGVVAPGPLADRLAKVVSAERSYWNDLGEPYLVAFVPVASRSGGSASGGVSRGDGSVLYTTPGAADDLSWTLAREHLHHWIPDRIARPESGAAAATSWLSDGFAEFLASRLLLRAGLVTPEEAVSHMGSELAAYEASPVGSARGLSEQRGMLLALRWDEAIRRKTDGKLDLDDVILRMREHYMQFAPGQGPDAVTGLVSAAWVVARVDLRPDIARYVEGGAYVDLPEQLFGGCLDALVTVAPGFDSGFDHMAAAATQAVKGVRRRGPAWNSGLRDGMRIEAMDLRAGDMTREIVITVRSAKGGKPRTIRYWPYGDNDVAMRKLQLAGGLSDAAKADCARKFGGL